MKPSAILKVIKEAKNYLRVYVKCLKSSISSIPGCNLVSSESDGSGDWPDSSSKHALPLKGRSKNEVGWGEMVEKASLSFVCSLTAILVGLSPTAVVLHTSQHFVPGTWPQLRLGANLLLCTESCSRVIFILWRDVSWIFSFSMFWQKHLRISCPHVSHSS